MSRKTLSVIIKLETEFGPEVVALLRQHLQSMHEYSPPESVHALDLSALKTSDVSFFCAWQDTRLAGFGAMKSLTADHAEIKSMRTAESCLRQGIAAALLEHILQVAKDKGYARVSLETGSMAQFNPAHKLYTRYGFEDCEPFADYVPDPNSIFMTRLV